MPDINTIKDKLAALLARARDAGSSDAEIAACMKRADKLMSEYNLTENDLQNVTSNDFTLFDYEKGEGRSNFDPVVRMCGKAVSEMCGVTLFFCNRGEAETIRMIGLEADVEYAKWLLHSFREFMNDQWLQYKNYDLGKVTKQRLKAERIGFVRGFCSAVSARIRDLTYRQDGGLGTGTALVAQKHDLVEQHLADQGYNLDRSRAATGGGKAAGGGEAHGRAAGQSANIGRGVGKSAIAIGSS